MSSSSSASSSSSSPPPSSPVPLKRKREEVDVEDSSHKDSDNSDAEPDSPDEPVLSHAERRRQKKKEKLKPLENPTSKKRKLKDGTAAPTTSVKRQNSVWVGNMSFKTTPENLRKFFEGVGEITRIHMPTKTPAGPGVRGENRGFAYVDFGTPDAKLAAIARSEQPLIGRKLLIKDGDDFTGRPAAPGAEGAIAAADMSKTHSKTAQKILTAQKQPPAPTLFLGNLGFEVTEKEIRELFEAHRAVKKKSKHDPEEDEKEKSNEVWIRKIRMGTFEDSGLCKGFAFVDFTTTEQATSVLINPKNHLLNGRKLVVEYASADAVRRGAPKMKREAGSALPRRETQSRGSRPERPDRQRHQDSSWPKPNGNAVDPPAVDVGQSDRPQKQHYSEKDVKTQPGGAGAGGKHKGPRTRPKPGAALALAKRESAAILPSVAQKITF